MVKRMIALVIILIFSWCSTYTYALLGDIETLNLPPINLDVTFTTQDPSWPSLKVSLNDPRLNVGIGWDPGKGFQLTTLSGESSTPIGDVSVSSEGMSFTGSQTLTFGDLEVKFGETLTLSPQGLSTKVSTSLQTQGNFLSLELGGDGSWQGKARVTTSENSDYAEVTIGRKQLVYEGVVKGKITLNGLGVVGEYSLNANGNYKLKLSQLREQNPQLAEQAERVAEDLARQSRQNESKKVEEQPVPGSDMQGGEEEEDEEELQVPQGWYLKLTPEQQEFALEVIRNKLGLILTTQGMNLEEIKLVVGIAEGRDQNDSPQTVVAFGLTRIKPALDISTAFGQESGADGGFSKDSDSSTSPALLALNIDISHGSLRARLGLDVVASPVPLRPTSASIATEGLSFTMSREDGVKLTLGNPEDENSPFSLTFSRGAGNPLSFIGRLALSPEIDLSWNFGVSPEGVAVSLGVSENDQRGVTVSWLPRIGLNEVKFYVTDPNTGLRWSIGFDREGRITLGLGT